MFLSNQTLAVLLTSIHSSISSTHSFSCFTCFGFRLTIFPPRFFVPINISFSILLFAIANSLFYLFCPHHATQRALIRLVREGTRPRKPLDDSCRL
ncbi:hypothetical protein ASPWEDRAFT_596791 [Aspergillus wentii DTO 134E9]|uniref:Uncharacterized protein n=1 Tax=Aspergillus wentii DTO 134E9 TaxID=1073089 RepID=A0A1L9RD93_ASPWE|nr:uncharacterized protein ASPWEDRAFT_596791 [Aspergillus wentii DTO 134E9]OJJ32882.1 hypothetical protein ASPWEDRAFT_596791 [Aspergillus wentii DTO 134E9]